MPLIHNQTDGSWEGRGGEGGGPGDTWVKERPVDDPVSEGGPLPASASVQRALHWGQPASLGADGRIGADRVGKLIVALKFRMGSIPWGQKTSRLQI